MDPAGMIGGKSAGWNRAVHVWMEQKVLSPGVQDAQKTNLRSQVLRVGRDFQEGGRAGLKQEVIEYFRMVLAKWNQLMRDGEDHMEIGHAEHLSFAGGEPALARLRLALWAVPIAARVIRDGLMAASRTGIDMAAERRCAATGDSSQHGEPLNAQP